MSRIAIDGVHWNVEVTGRGPHLLLLHGFTGSHATWAPHLDAWREFTTIAVDLPGHGDSDAPHDVNRYGFDATVNDLTRLLDALGVPTTAVLGYSMGGRLALHLAVRLARERPGRLPALIIESASPGIASAAERRERLARDLALARSIERDGVASFVDRWEAQPLFATQKRLPAATRDAVRRQRLAANARGLASTLRGMSVGLQTPLHDRLRSVDVPALLVAGELDAAYCRHARALAAALPRSQVATVPDAGHAVHLEKPASFANIVRDFLQQHVPRETQQEESHHAQRMETSS